MAKPTIMDEVSVLKYFETGPIEKIEVVFNIVVEKMRERLSGRSESPRADQPSTPTRKRQSRPVPESAETATV